MTGGVRAKLVPVPRRVQFGGRRREGKSSTTMYEAPTADAYQAEHRLQQLLHSPQMTQLIAGATGQAEQPVADRLQAEARSPGSTVATEIRRRGVVPFEWSEGLLRFYSESDAFLFELAIWNRQAFKRSMRTWTRRALDAEARRLGRPLTVLAYGDGIGVDAASAALGGHTVTWYEVPGLSERVARGVFGALDLDVEVQTDVDALAGRSFDAITCFDVLEHVPKPRDLLAHLVARLGQGGLFFVHAPFYLVLPAYPTHLRENRRFAGRTSLFERAGLTLLDGGAAWNPLLFRKGGSEGQAGWTRLALIRTMGLLLQSGRYASFQFRPFHALLRH